MTEKSGTLWFKIPPTTHKNTSKCKNLVDSGLISGWKLTELTEEKRNRVCKANVVLLPSVLSFLPKDRQIGKITQRQVKAYDAG